MPASTLIAQEYVDALSLWRHEQRSHPLERTRLLPGAGPPRRSPKSQARQTPRLAGSMARLDRPTITYRRSQSRTTKEKSWLNLRLKSPATFLRPFQGLIHGRHFADSTCIILLRCGLRSKSYRRIGMLLVAEILFFSVISVASC